MEWFWLIISVPVLSSNNIGVSVLFGFPRGLVEELGICLEAACNSAASISLFQGAVEFDRLNWHLGVSIWLGPVIWLQIGLSESGAPLFMKCLMWYKPCGFSITSEEIWASFIEILLISHETKNKASVKWFYETYSLLANLSAVFWKPSSLTKHLLVILE